MEITTTRQAGHVAQEAMPACPECGSDMLVRAQWHNGQVAGLNWVCRRAPGCEGVRRVRHPDEIRPLNHDASTQAIFDWESSREPRRSNRREAGADPAAQIGGLLGKLFARPTATLDDYDAASSAGSGTMGFFDGLVEQGFVVLEDRALHAARVAIDNVLIGPTGVFVVERKAWPGYLALAPDSIYVDGRQRMGAIDAVLRARDALEQTLGHELKPTGATVRPAMLFENATNKSVEGMVDKVLIGGTRGLPKMLRGSGKPVLGPETIVRIALAADRLLD